MLNRFDLATLYEKAELIVFVQNFQPSAKNTVGTGFVGKVHKGDYPVGQRIQVIPWAVDFSRVSGIRDGRLPPTFDALFFLVKQPDHRVWETVLSGIRIVIENEVLGVRPTGPVSYAIVKAASELLIDNRESYDYEALLADLRGTADRLAAVDDALGKPATTDGLAQLHQVLDRELKRGFPSTTRSEPLWRMLLRLAEFDLIEDLWRLRERVPRAAMGREFDHLVARNIGVEFFLARLVGKQRPKDLKSTLSFITANSFPLDLDVQLQVLEWLIDWVPQYPASIQPLGFEAAAAILDVVPVTLPADLRLQLNKVANRGTGAARFYLRPAVLTKYPQLAADHFESPLRLFGHIGMRRSNLRQLAGEVKLRRLRSQCSFSEPRLVCERVTKAGGVLERHNRFLSLPTRVLESGYVGSHSSSFSWSFQKSLLGSGEWRIYLEMDTSEPQYRTWQTEYSTFIVRLICQITADPSGLQSC